MSDLSTVYLGLRLKSPVVPSACQPLTETIANIRQMEDRGAGAVVLYSLFEEQLTADSALLHQHLTDNADSFSEAASFFPEPSQFLLGPDEYLNHIANAKKAVRIPIIASLNGSTPGGWTNFAKQMEQAGADAIELNIYRVQTDLDLTPAQIEAEYIDVAKSVLESVKIPVTVKLSPYFTSLANMAKRLDETGVSGLTLFNRFYQPDIDLESLEVRPDVLLSSPLSLRLPLRWIAILYGRISADLAGTSGVHKAEDCIKLLMAGAKVTMVCASLLRFGIEYIEKLNEGIAEWMDKNSYPGLDMLQGSMSQAKCPEPQAFERVQYIRALHDYRRKKSS